MNMKRIIDLVEKIFSDSEEERNIDLITLKYLVELRRERERTPLNEEWIKARNWTRREREFLSPYYTHSVGDYTIEIETAFKGYRVRLIKWRKGRDRWQRDRSLSLGTHQGLHVI